MRFLSDICFAKEQQEEVCFSLCLKVQVAPADTFKTCITATHSRCKLGLTATLVREDEKIQDLFSLIGLVLCAFFPKFT